MQRSDYLSLFEAGKARFVESWKEYVRIPSISSDPAYAPDCQRGAEWMRAYLERMGLKAQVFPSSGQPLVFAERAGDATLPTLLFYGHYDVQPADPLAEWTNPPFEPEVRDGRLYGRGALDNKGQTMAFLAGLETVLQAGTFSAPLKVIIEGEEESGSSGLFDSLQTEEWRKRLRADVLLVDDSEAYAPGIPAITMGLRGIIHLSVKLFGANFDLHSGLHGGIAPNPAMALARLLATIHNPDGSIAVKGFCDTITPLDEETRRLLRSAPFDQEKYEADFGIKALGGERGFTPEERLAFRPTIEVNGIHSGHGGPGQKTIIPAKAEAKITSRIVAGQDPVRSLALIEEHLRAHAPEGLRLVIDEKGGVHRALAVNPHSGLLKRAARVLEAAYQHKPVYLWCPGSIPIVVSLVEALGAEPLLVGFGLPEDRMHAPDESFSLVQFRDGFLYACLMLEELSLCKA